MVLKLENSRKAVEKCAVLAPGLAAFIYPLIARWYLQVTTPPPLSGEVLFMKKFLVMTFVDIMVQYIIVF